MVIAVSHTDGLGSPPVEFVLYTDRAFETPRMDVSGVIAATDRQTDRQTSTQYCLQ